MRQPEQPNLPGLSPPIRHVAPVRGVRVQFDPRPSPAHRGEQDTTTLTGDEARRRERER